MHVSIEEALQKLQDIPDAFIALFTHGTLRIELYKPEKIDLQTPHDEDEVYVIVSGTGKFLNGETTILFQANDVLFVPAGIHHKFFDFTPDFCTWVIFYGPKGGEKPIQ